MGTWAASQGDPSAPWTTSGEPLGAVAEIAHSGTLKFTVELCQDGGSVSAVCIIPTPFVSWVCSRPSGAAGRWDSQHGRETSLKRWKAGISGTISLASKCLPGSLCCCHLGLTRFQLACAQCPGSAGLLSQCRVLPVHSPAHAITSLAWGKPCMMQCLGLATVSPAKLQGSVKLIWGPLSWRGFPLPVSMLTRLACAHLRMASH